MTIYLVELHYAVDRAAREAVHPDHAVYLRSLTEWGVLKLAGPLEDENAGVLVYEARSADELQSILEREPYIVAGLVARTVVRPWSPGKGAWARETANTESSR